MASRDENLQEMARLATKAELACDVPALCIVAQWAIESEWGEKPIGRYNVFGIKHAARHSLAVLVPTTEYLTDTEIEVWNKFHPDYPAQVVESIPTNGKFRVRIADIFAEYDSLWGAVCDYTLMIRTVKPYSVAWAVYQNDHVLRRFIVGIAAAYSTSPFYGRLVTTITEQDNVIQAILNAKKVAKG